MDEKEREEWLRARVEMNDEERKEWDRELEAAMERAERLNRQGCDCKSLFSCWIQRNRAYYTEGLF